MLSLLFLEPFAQEKKKVPELNQVSRGAAQQHAQSADRARFQCLSFAVQKCL